MKQGWITLLFLFFPVLCFGRWVELSNEIIRMVMDNDSGRFTLWTVAGDSGMPGDENQPLLYDRTPPTSMMTLSIDGQTVIFGSDSGSFKRRPFIDGKRILTEWTYSGISVEQEMTIVRGMTTGMDDTMQVNYRVKNTTGKRVRVGMRVILDMLLGQTEPKSFGIPGRGNVSQESIIYRDNIPPYFYCYDNPDNPVIRSQVTLIGGEATRPDKLLFSSWDRIYEQSWDVMIDSSRDFRKSGTFVFDSACALYYDPVDLSPDQSMMVTLLYGLYGTSIFTEKDMVLTVSVPMEPKNPPVPISADFQNQSKEALDRLELSIDLPKGFTLPPDETNTLVFFKVEAGAFRRGLWNLNCRSLGGSFNVKVKAVGYLGSARRELTAEKQFHMTYIENMGLPPAIVTPSPSPAPAPVSTPEAAAETKPIEAVVLTDVTNRLLPTPSPRPRTQTVRPKPANPEAAKLMEEIEALNDFIADVSRDYDILWGIYQNSTITNSEFMRSIDVRMSEYRNRLKIEEIQGTNHRSQRR